MSEKLVLLTVDEVAEKLGMHPQTVYRNREFPRVKVGPRKLRFIESQIDQFILLQTSRKPAPKPGPKRKKQSATL